MRVCVGGGGHYFFRHKAHIFTYCMTGRAIQGNIQFEGGSLARPTTGKDNEN
jgi:hypothetical protein